MRNLRIWVFLIVWAGFGGPGVLYAQNTPFQNPALDSDCYFPQIGVPGEIDTIVGDSANAGIGAYIHNLGPQQGGIPGNMLIANIEGNAEEVSTGSSFNLHNLHAITQHISIGEGNNLRFAHLHNSTSIDIFDEDTWRIYWADENGNYDTAHIPNCHRILPAIMASSNRAMTSLAILILHT
jgi:hypothetical protein